MRQTPAPFPHIYRNLLVTKDLRQSSSSHLVSQIAPDISTAATACVEESARDVRKVGRRVSSDGHWPPAARRIQAISNRILRRAPSPRPYKPFPLSSR